jgi:hypothetical protein
LPIFGFWAENIFFLASKKFGQNARNFGPPATSKVTIFEKKPQMPNLNFFQMAKIRPEKKISR